MKNIPLTIESLESRNLLAGIEDDYLDIFSEDSGISYDMDGTCSIENTLSFEIINYSEDQTNTESYSIPEDFFELAEDNNTKDDNMITSVLQSLHIKDTGHIKGAIGFVAGAFQSVGQFCSSASTAGNFVEIIKPSSFSKRSWGITLGAAGEIFFKVGTGLEEINHMIPSELNSN